MACVSPPSSRWPAGCGGSAAPDWPIAALPHCGPAGAKGGAGAPRRWPPEPGHPPGAAQRSGPALSAPGCPEDDRVLPGFQRGLGGNTTSGVAFMGWRF